MILQKRISEWANETFPSSTNEGKFNHLVEEILELKEALESTNVHRIQEEISDCLMILYHLGDGFGIDVQKATIKKLLINKARSWGEPNDNGIIHHVPKSPERG